MILLGMPGVVMVVSLFKVCTKIADRPNTCQGTSSMGFFAYYKSRNIAIFHLVGHERTLRVAGGF